MSLPPAYLTIRTRPYPGDPDEPDTSVETQAEFLTYLPAPTEGWDYLAVTELPWAYYGVPMSKCTCSPVPGTPTCRYCDQMALIFEDTHFWEMECKHEYVGYLRGPDDLREAFRSLAEDYVSLEDDPDACPFAREAARDARLSGGGA